MTTTERLRRSSKDKILLGVAGGIGEYFDVDPVLVRVGFVLLTLAGGSGIIAYFILALVMPLDEAASTEDSGAMSENAQNTPTHADRPDRSRRRRNAFGLILILAGLLFLFANLGIFWFKWSVFWPLLIIAVGVAIIYNRSRSRP